MTGAGLSLMPPRMFRPALVRIGLTFCLAVPLAACQRPPAAPTFVFFGSYFPAWIVCAILGVVVAVAVRKLFIVIGLDEVLPVRLIVYASLALMAAVGLWSLWFGGSPG